MKKFKNYFNKYFLIISFTLVIVISIIVSIFLIKKDTINVSKNNEIAPYPFRSVDESIVSAPVTETISESPAAIVKNKNDGICLKTFNSADIGVEFDYPCRFEITNTENEFIKITLMENNQSTVLSMIYKTQEAESFINELATSVNRRSNMLLPEIYINSISHEVIDTGFGEGSGDPETGCGGTSDVYKFYFIMNTSLYGRIFLSTSTSTCNGITTKGGYKPDLSVLEEVKEIYKNLRFI
jgi:hypothetical protein